MERDKHLEIVRQACIAAHKGVVPDGETVTYRVYELAAQHDVIRLADVLLAIEARKCKECSGAGGSLGDSLGYSSCNGCDGDIYFSHDVIDRLGDVVNYWNLRADDLEQQSDETIKVLAELLS